MTDAQIKSIRKHVRHLDRITLDSSALARIDQWHAQLTSSQRGIFLTRKDLVNYLLNSRPSDLTAPEIDAISARYFDKVRFLEETIKQLKQATKDGLDVSLDELLLTRIATQNVSRRPSRKVTSKRNNGNEFLTLQPEEQVPSH